MIFAALAVAATVAAAPAPVLCIAGACNPVSAETVTIAAADEARPFVLISADRRRVFAGVIPAGAVVVEPGDAGVTQKLSVKTSDGVFPAATFELQCRDLRWTWLLDPLPKQPFVIGRAAGDCTLTVAAVGYKTAELKLTGEAAVAYLHRLPTLSVVVSDATTRVPIAGAEIFGPGGELLGSTGDRGRFAAVVGRWPSTLRVEAAGKAPRRVNVPKAVADTEIPVALSAGGSIAVTLPESLSKEQLGWEVRSESGELARSGRVPAGQTEMAIEGLDPARYALIVSGDGPLQRIGVPVVVRESRTSDVTVPMEPAVLALEVRLGEEPLGSAEVEMTFENGLWRSRVKTDPEGRAVEELWQRGDYAAVVSRTPIVRFWREKRRLDEDGVSDWKITVADRRVRGRVKDESTGSGIADAQIKFTTASDGMGAVVMGTSSLDGSYEFTAVPPGTYQLSVMKTGYIPVETQRITVAENVTVETRDISMRSTAGRAVTVVDARRMPLSGAVIYVASQNGIRLAGATDDGGRLELPLSSHEAGYLFAIPRSGSLGMARFVSLLESDSPDVSLRVADGEASLELHAESTSGDPLPGLSILMRIDGVLLPPTVREGFSHYLGIPLRTDADGRLNFPRLPPGRYEVWPLASRADYDAVRSAAPPPAPINIMLTPGHHTAKLKFAPRE